MVLNVFKPAILRFTNMSNTSIRLMEYEIRHNITQIYINEEYRYYILDALKIKNQIIVLNGLKSAKFSFDIFV